MRYIERPKVYDAIQYTGDRGVIEKWLKDKYAYVTWGDHSHNKGWGFLKWGETSTEMFSNTSWIIYDGKTFQTLTDWEFCAKFEIEASV